MKHVKTGALIAFAAGSLFASACEKKEDKPADKPAAKQPPATPDPAAKPKADKPGLGTVAPVEQPADVPAEKVSKVDCSGVNECKGQGTCKQETHGCGGQNACKGQGVLTMAEDECKQKGGTVASK